MKKMIHYKRIMGLLILGLALLAYPGISVYADSPIVYTGTSEPSAECSSFINSTTYEEFLGERYGIEVRYDGDNFIIEMKNDASLSDKISKIRSNVTFKLVSIGNFKPGGSSKSYDDYIKSKIYNTQINDENTIRNSYIISSNKVISAKNNAITVTPIAHSNGYDYYDFKIEPVGFQDPKLKEVCGSNATFGIVLDINAPGVGTTKMTRVSGTKPVHSSITTKSSSELCKNYENLNKTSFDYKFCSARAMATKYSKDAVDIKEPFKCNAFALSTGTDDNKYYLPENTQYLKTESTEDINVGDYVYNYECGQKRVAAKCKVKCEEVVTVEYGPPVARVSSMCFQYKVRVTSRVNCDLESGPNEPRYTEEFCTPTPICRGAYGTYNQGGPSEDFDACIKSCDGGKYTEKCSKKCYSKVYGSGSYFQTSSNMLSFANKISNGTTVTTKKVNDGSLKYVCNGGVIRWDVGDNLFRNNLPPGQAQQPWYRDSTWHKTHAWGVGTDYMYYSSTGIPRASNCTENCYWVGCSGDVYLNQKTAEDDNASNEQTYQKLKDSCEKHVKCSTETAEFTISVDYRYNTKEGVKTSRIYFPYSDNNANVKDSIKFGAINTISNVNTTLLGSDGCYAANKNEDDKWYQAEWSFPGTWMLSKDGEISYSQPPTSGVNSWKYKKKFCLPSDAANVNTKWWAYYYKKMYQNDPSFAFNDSEYMNNIAECDTSSGSSNIACQYSRVTFTDDDAKNIRYNIHASTKNFGYFKWNLKIECFYAINNGKNLTNVRDCNCPNPSTSSTPYRIRTVDLEQLFPNKESSKTSSTKEERSPGFNWSKYANTTLKDPLYASKPSAYANWVKTTGYSVYSDRYLDYEVNLSPETLRKLKSSDRNYTAYEGKISLDGSVSNYESPLFRGQNSILKNTNSKYPNNAALKCNNMKNYSSNECESFKEE